MVGGPIYSEHKVRLELEPAVAPVEIETLPRS